MEGAEVGISFNLFHLLIFALLFAVRLVLGNQGNRPIKCGVLWYIFDEEELEPTVYHLTP